MGRLKGESKVKHAARFFAVMFTFILVASVTASVASADPGWESKAAYPGAIGVTTACYAENAGVKYVYAFEGKASPDYVHRYDIAANTWTNMFNMAVTASSGISVVWNRADNIYWLSGGSAPSFYAYYISSNTKSAALAVPPQRAASGSTLAYDGGDNIYALLVNSSTYQSWIYSYSISGNIWTFIDNTPEKIGTGGGLIRLGNYLYVASSIFAVQAGHFLRYDLVNAKWDWLASLPLSGPSPSVHWDSGDGLENVGTNHIYANVGGSTQTGFFRFNISENKWYSLENSPSAQSNAGDRLAFDGTYLYLVRAYTDSSFWRYAVDLTAPSAPALISPENCHDILDNTPTFMWTSVTDPSGVTYQIQIDDSKDFSSPVYFAVGLTVNENTLPDENALEICVHYWWRVRAKDNACNTGLWSEEWHFHVVPVGAIGVLLMPLLMLLPFALMLRRQNRRYHY